MLRLLTAPIGVAVLLLTACSDDDGASPTTAVEATGGRDDPWQRLIDQFAADSPGVPGIALAVLAPSEEVDVAVAAGSGDPASARPLSPDQPFRISSNTKSFTAAATLRLVEQETIGLDDPIAGLIDPAFVELPEDDGYDAGDITVRQLLQHTSGLYDFASDVDFQTLVLGGEGEQHWERIDQVRFAMEQGDPLGPPGAQFAYSDTGYAMGHRAVEAIFTSAVSDLPPRTYEPCPLVERASVGPPPGRGRA